MNTTRNALAALVLLGASTSAIAAPTVDLIVKGVITPNACTPALSGSGVVDYGKISAKDLNLTTPTPLPAATLQLTITCDGVTLFAIKGTDNRAGTSASNGYGMGLINGTQKLGTYWVGLANAVADAVETTVLESLDNGVTWMDLGDDSQLQISSLAAFGDRSTGVFLPVAIRDVTTDLTVWGAIARADGLDLNDEHPIDGSATFEVKYL